MGKIEVYLDRTRKRFDKIKREENFIYFQEVFDEVFEKFNQATINCQEFTNLLHNKEGVVVNWSKDDYDTFLDLHFGSSIKIPLSITA